MNKVPIISKSNEQNDAFIVNAEVMQEENENLWPKQITIKNEKYVGFHTISTKKTQTGKNSEVRIRRNWKKCLDEQQKHISKPPMQWCTWTTRRSD